MNKYILLAGILVFVLIATGMYTQMTVIDDTSYDTNTRTSTVDWWAYSDSTKYHSYGYIDENSELISSDRIALAWSDNSLSEDISIGASGMRPGHKRSAFPLVIDNPFFSQYWYQVEVYHDGQWTTIFDRDGKKYTKAVVSTNQPMNKIGWSEERLVPDWKIQPPEPGESGLVKCQSAEDAGYGFAMIQFTNKPFKEDPDAEQILMASPNSFRLKGDDFAGSFMRVSLCSYILYHDGTTHCKVQRWVTDDVVLSSGVGDLTIDPSPHGGSVFEVGETIGFSVKTGYAGESGDGKPWMIELHEPNGQVAVGRNIVIKDNSGNIVLNTGTSKEARFYVKNDLSYKHFTWKISDDTVHDEDANYGYNWNFYLKNTVTNWDSEWVFLVQEGDAECGPVNVGGEMTINGNSITLLVTADGNKDCGIGDVDHFKVQFYADSLLYAEETWPAVTSTNGGWRAIKTFTFPYDDKSFTCKVKAFDSNGLPSITEWGDTGYVGSDNKGALIFIVSFDNNPIQGAIITIENERLVTDAFGRASITLPLDQLYSVTTSYRGSSISRQIYLREDGQEERFNLGMSTSNIISIAIIVAIITIVTIISILLPVHIAYRIMLIMIGIFASIFIYLIMNGYL